MKFYKKIALVGLSALTVLSLTACGATNQSSHPANNQQQTQNNNNNTENDHDGAPQSEIKKSNKLTKEDSQYVKDIDVVGPAIDVKLQPSVQKTFVKAENDLDKDMKQSHHGNVTQYPMNSTDKRAVNICTKIRKDISKKVSNDSQIRFMGMLNSKGYNTVYTHGITSSDFGYGNTTQSVQNQP